MYTYAYGPQTGRPFSRTNAHTHKNHNNTTHNADRHPPPRRGLPPALLVRGAAPAGRGARATSPPRPNKGRPGAWSVRFPAGVCRVLCLVQRAGPAAALQLFAVDVKRKLSRKSTAETNAYTRNKRIKAARKIWWCLRLAFFFLCPLCCLSATNKHTPCVPVFCCPLALFAARAMPSISVYQPIVGLSNTPDALAAGAHPP